MRRRSFVPLHLLVVLMAVLIAGCNMPVASLTPAPLPHSSPTATSTPAPTATITATATTYSQYPYLDVPLQAVLVTDDDGSHAVVISYDQIKVWVDRANTIYAPAGIRFSFSLQDMITINSSLLNNMISNQDVPWDAEVATANKVAANHPGKLTVFFRRGSGENPLGGAFSSSNYNFVVMPQYSDSWCNNTDDHGMLAHEIGHYLGLGHIFPNVFNNLPEAEKYLAANNNNPNAFDADKLSDTLPDPYIGEDYYTCGTVAEVTLNGIKFVLPRDNIMSYYNGRTSLSGQQMELVRWYLEKRRQNKMAMPTNVNAPDPLEAQSMSVQAISGCSSSYQDMTAFGDTHRWYHDDQLFVSSGKNCSITLALPVPAAGRYRLDLYLTTTPDFAIVQVLLDSKPAGDPIDLYAPAVMPSGPITIGEFDLEKKTHFLTFKVVGKNERSTYYSMGLDCFSLVPLP
jgi:hypothetical protein